MRSQDHFAAEFFLDVGLYFVELDRAVRRVDCRLDTRAKVDNFERAPHIFGDICQQLDSRHSQARAVSAVGHGNQVDLIVLGEFAILFFDPLEALRSSDARMILDAFAVEDGYVRHNNLLYS